MLVSAPQMGKRVAQHQVVIDAAAQANVELLVYASMLRATESPLALAGDHVATERAIAASGLPSVLLRNDWYTENYAGDLAQAAETGAVVAATGAGRVASASSIDYADAAAVVLIEDGHAGRVYELAGDVAWSYADLAAAMAQVLGRSVEYRSLSFEERASELTGAGLDAGTVAFLTDLDAGIRAGALDAADRTMSRLIGRPTTPLVEGLRASRNL